MRSLIGSAVVTLIGEPVEVMIARSFASERREGGRLIANFEFKLQRAVCR